MDGQSAVAMNNRKEIGSNVNGSDSIVAVKVRRTSDNEKEDRLLPLFFSKR